MNNDKFNKTYERIMSLISEGIESPYNSENVIGQGVHVYRNAENYRIGKDRRRQFDKFISKIEESFEKKEFLKIIFSGVKDIDSLNISEERIDFLVNRVKEFLREEIHKNNTWRPGLVASVLNSANGTKDDIKRELYSIANNDSLNRKLFDILSAAVPSQIEGLGTIDIVEKDGQVGMYRHPYSPESKPVNGHTYKMSDGIVNWFKENYAKKNRLVVADYIKL